VLVFLLGHLASPVQVPHQLQNGRQPHTEVTEFLMKVELELSSLSGIALTLRKPSIEPNPIEKLRLTLVFQRMVDSSLLILI
jgi:transposase